MKLFVRDFGGKDKEPLVILHGLFGSSRNWQTMGKRLAQHFHVFALDLPDHGESLSKKNLSYHSVAEDVLETLDQLQLQQIHLLGHSMGGKVAMHFACIHPERVRRLIIVDVAPKDYPSYQKEVLALQKLDLQHLSGRQAALHQLQKEIPDLKTRQFLLTNLVRSEDGAFVWKIDLEALAKNQDVIRKTSLKKQHQFAGPTLFIVSRNAGYVTALDHPEIRTHFPRAEIAALDNTGHNIHIDAPEKFLALITDD